MMVWNLPCVLVALAGQFLVCSQALLKNQRMFFLIGGSVIELVGIVFIAMSIGSDSSPMTGIFIMIIDWD